MTSSTVCQSCSMPLQKPEEYGTEIGGTRAEEFCTHCYQGGSFTAPHMTTEQMADVVAGFMEGMPKAEATQAALTGIPA